jgi:hypothetical protein
MSELEYGGKLNIFRGFMVFFFFFFFLCFFLFFRGDKNIILREQIYKYVYFKTNFENFGRTFVAQPKPWVRPSHINLSILEVWLYPTLLSYLVKLGFIKGF